MIECTIAKKLVFSNIILVRTSVTCQKMVDSMMKLVAIVCILLLAACKAIRDREGESLLIPAFHPRPTSPLQEIVGTWVAVNSSVSPSQQYVFVIYISATGAMQVATVGYPVSWSDGTATLSANNVVTLTVDTGEVIAGKLYSKDDVITWSTPHPYSSWSRVPAGDIDTVHVVFMNHLDVGYNGIPQTGYINNVLNNYFQEYFPRAVELAEAVKQLSPSDSFVYTSHPWLVSMYTDCPPNLVFNDVKLACPNEANLKAFLNAVSKGTVVWHAGSMNMQYELLDRYSLLVSFQLAESLSDKFGLPYSCSVSLRDVPGLPSSALDVMHSYFFKLCNRLPLISVGVNPGTSPPVTLADIFGWGFTGSGSAPQSLATWHSGGYPLNPGFDIAFPGGLSYRDVVTIPKAKLALAFAFRTDNSGPPRSTAEVHDNLEILRSQFPKAKVVASSLDRFSAELQKTWTPDEDSQKDIGDTWIQGVASDPRKMAEFRALRQAYADCNIKGACNITDRRLLNATRFMIKLAEHTWGLPSVGDNINWSNKAFQRVKGQSNYKACVNSWDEQRAFVPLTLEALEDHPMAQLAHKFLAELTVPDPSVLSDYVKFDATKELVVCPTCPQPLTVHFDPTTGALKDMQTSTTTWTDKSHLAAMVTYHTYNETDFNAFRNQYDYYGNAGYDKPNSTANAHPVSKTWLPTKVEFGQSKFNKYNILAMLAFDSISHIDYGSPEMILLNYSFTSTNASQFTVDVIWFNKTATRLGEATMFSFYPAATKGDPNCFVYQFDQLVPVADSVTNGSIYQRGGDGFGCNFTSTQCTAWMSVESLDVPLVCPILDPPQQPTPFPFPAHAEQKYVQLGVGFNLHNNIWNTNYPLWYPFEDGVGDENFKARFAVKLTSTC